ncbi:MAG: hypothetical protein ACREXT_12635, partial [Gammaproteobacteria bacterium]
MLPLVGIITALWFSYLAVRPEFSGLLADAYIYLLIAAGIEHLGAGATDPALSFLFAHYPFPPLFPMLLAATGAGPDQPAWTYAVNASVLGLAMLFLAYWYRQLGMPRTVAALLVLVIAALPAVWLTAMDVQSEPLYLTLSAACLLALGRDPKPAWRVAGLACGLAVITRTVGIALLAIFLIDWWRRGRRSDLTPILVALGPIATWSVIRLAFGFDASYLAVDQALLGDSPSALFPVIKTNALALATYGVRSFDLSGQAYAQIVIATLGGIALLEYLNRLRCSKPDAWYVTCYLSLILCWPYPYHARRFLLMILPLLMGYAVLFAYRMCRSRVSVTVTLGATCSVIALFALTSLPST